MFISIYHIKFNLLHDIIVNIFDIKLVLNELILLAIKLLIILVL